MILNELCSHEDSSPFLEPVDIAAIPVRSNRLIEGKWTNLSCIGANS